MTSQATIGRHHPPPGISRSIRPFTSGAFRLGNWLIEPSLGRISQGGLEHIVQPKTMDVLQRLAVRCGDVVSSEQLIQSVWRGRPMGDNPVHKCISQLRHALGDDARHPSHIGTIPRKGYRLLARAVPLAGATEPAAATGPLRVCIDIWPPVRVAPGCPGEAAGGVEIAASRGAGRRVEGSVRVAGRDLRVAARVLDARGEPLDSVGVVDLRIDDLVGVIHEIVRALTRAPR